MAFITGAIRLDEDRVGVSETAVYIRNLLHCVGVAVKLNRAGVAAQPPIFLGMHIFGATKSEWVDFMLQYVKDKFLIMGTVAEVVVCLDRESVDTYDVKSQDLLTRVENTFGRPIRILHKPAASTDMWLHVPTAANSPWIRTRSPSRDDYYAPPETNETVARLRTTSNPLGLVSLEMVGENPMLNLPNTGLSLEWKDVNTNQLPTTL